MLGLKMTKPENVPVWFLLQGFAAFYVKGVHCDVKHTCEGDEGDGEDAHVGLVAETDEVEELRDDSEEGADQRERHGGDHRLQPV